MNENEYWYNRTGQDRIYSDQQHEAKMSLLITEQEYQLFAMLKPELKVDGKQWCVLYGNDLQDGIAGFGDTPYLAIIDWNKQFHSKIK
jgi:hypothetical protein